MADATIPLNQNLLQPTKFQVMFSRLPNTQFYLTKTTLPGFIVSEADQPTPFVNLKVPGTKIKFEPWNMSFNVDAQLNGWYDIFIWMQGIGMPQSFSQYANLANNAPLFGNTTPTIGVRPPYSDATLTLYSPKNNPIVQVNFKDCYPIYLSTIDLDYSKSADNIISVDTQFRYSYYTVEQLS